MSWVVPLNDVWCEFLEFPDGHWDYWFHGRQPVLGVNTLDYKVGALAIELACIPSPHVENMLELRLFFNEGRELNLLDANLLELWVKMTKLQGIGGFKPGFTTHLISPSTTDPTRNVAATKTFQMSSEDWQLLNTGVGPYFEYEWIVQAGFDWTKINQMSFYFEQNKGPLTDPPIHYLRLDGILFQFIQEISIITVESNPFQGVPTRINGIIGSTPVSWIIDPPSIRTVTVVGEYEGWKFNRWDSGETTLGKVIDASTPGFYNAIAFYEQITPPNGDGVIPPLPRPRLYPGYLREQFWMFLELLRKRRR